MTVVDVDVVDVVTVVVVVDDAVVVDVAETVVVVVVDEVGMQEPQSTGQLNCSCALVMLL